MKSGALNKKFGQLFDCKNTELLRSTLSKFFDENYQSQMMEISVQSEPAASLLPPPPSRPQQSTADNLSLLVDQFKSNSVMLTNNIGAQLDKLKAKQLVTLFKLDQKGNVSKAVLKKAIFFNCFKTAALSLTVAQMNTFCPAGPSNWESFFGKLYKSNTHIEVINQMRSTIGSAVEQLPDDVDMDSTDLSIVTNTTFHTASRLTSPFFTAQQFANLVPEIIDAQTIAISKDTSNKVLWTLVHDDNVINNNDSIIKSAKRQLLDNLFVPEKTPFMDLPAFQAKFKITPIGNYTREKIIDHIKKQMLHSEHFEQMCKSLTLMVVEDRNLMQSRLHKMISLMNSLQQSNFLRDAKKLLEGENLAFLDQYKTIRSKNLQIVLRKENMNLQYNI